MRKNAFSNAQCYDYRLVIPQLAYLLKKEYRIGIEKVESESKIKPQQIFVAFLIRISSFLLVSRVIRGKRLMLPYIEDSGRFLLREKIIRTLKK